MTGLPDWHPQFDLELFSTPSQLKAKINSFLWRGYPRINVGAIGLTPECPRCAHEVLEIWLFNRDWSQWFLGCGHMLDDQEMQAMLDFHHWRVADQALRNRDQAATE